MAHKRFRQLPFLAIPIIGALAGVSVSEAQTMGMVIDNNRRVVFLDTATRSVTGTPLILSFTNSLLDCVISPDGRTGYITDYSKKIWVVDLAVNPPVLAGNGVPIPLSIHPQDLTITWDGRFLVSGGLSPNYIDKEPISIVDTARRIELRTWQGPDSYDSIEVCEDGTVLAGDGYRIRKFSLSTGGLLSDTGRGVYVGFPINVTCSPGGSSGLWVDFSPALGSFTVPTMTSVDRRVLSGDVARSAVVDSTGEAVYVVTSESAHKYLYDSVSGRLGLNPLLDMFMAYGGAASFSGLEQLALDPDETSLYVPQQFVDYELPSIKVFETQTGALLATLTNNIGQPAAICLPPPRDSDHDGLPDRREVQQSTDPNLPDTDGDGLLDGFEFRHALDPLVAGEQSEDTDQDGLDNLGEQVAHTYPKIADTDEDGLPDGAEVSLGADPLYFDSDGDGLSDGDEVGRYGTDPLLVDTDGGGGSDKDEVEFGSDARDPADDPVQVPTPVQLYDGNGFLWGINSCGAINESTDHAYDYGMTLFLNGDGFCHNPQRPALSSSDGRLVFLGPETIGGLVVSRKIFVPENESFVRYLEILENTGPVVITRKLTIQSILGSAAATEVISTSNGDLVFNKFDDYLVTDDVDRAGTPALAHVFSGRNASLQPSEAVVAPWAGGYFSYSFELAIPPGGKVMLIHFASQNATRAIAAQSTSDLFNLDGRALDHLTRIEQEAVVNFVAFTDSDRDGLIDEEEARLGTDPHSQDTDDDGLLDFFEVRYGFDPLNPGDELLDADDDGLTNLQEQALGTDPRNLDTDADGVSDGLEVMSKHTDPLNPDTDGDTVLDGADNCPLTANTNQWDRAHPNGIGDACEDPDNDAVFDLADNCPDAANPGQEDQVHVNGIGDACDDPDHDGVYDLVENCPDSPNTGQEDVDGDSVGDACDSCPEIDNPAQTETMACLEVGGSSSCMESSISLVDGFTEGEVQVIEDRKVVPIALNFEMNVTSCDSVAPIEFFLNGSSLGVYSAPLDCACEPPTQNFSVNDAAQLRSIWNPDGNNTLSVAKAGTPGGITGTWVAWIRAKFTLPPGEPDRQACLYDIRGTGDCVHRNQCLGGTSSNASLDVDYLLAPPFIVEEVHASAAFTDSHLPNTIDLLTLPDGPARLCVKPPDGPVLYGTTTSGNLYALDVASVTGQFVGKIPFIASEIEYDDTTARAYAQSYYPPHIQEFRIRNGTAAALARFDYREMLALEFVGSRLYGVDFSNAIQSASLWEITPETGISRQRFQLGQRLIQGLAYDPASGKLYAAESAFIGGNRLLEINLATNSIITIGTLSFSPSSLEFGPDGFLYAASSGYTTSDLYRISTNNATATFVGTFPFGALAAMTLVTRPPTECIGFVKEGQRTLRINSSCGNAPTANVQAGSAVECTSPAGGTVILDGSGSTDPDSTPGTNDDIVLFDWSENDNGLGQRFLGEGEQISVVLPVGTHEITLRVTDRAGATATTELMMEVVDSTPPILTVVATPQRLWPPDHRMVTVRVALSTSDSCGTPSPSLVSVSSNELDDAPGKDDGHTTGDIRDATLGVADLNLLLRAERSAAGTGRVYTIVYRSRDGAGNVTENTALVTVPLLKNSP